MGIDREVINTVKMQERVEEEIDDLVEKDGSSELIVYKSEKERLTI